MYTSTTLTALVTQIEGRKSLTVYLISGTNSYNLTNTLIEREKREKRPYAVDG